MQENLQRRKTRCKCIQCEQDAQVEDYGPTLLADRREQGAATLGLFRAIVS